MQFTWKARLGVTAAFVGGFWLFGQATASADENSATDLQSVTTAVSQQSGAATSGGYGSGDTEAVAASEAEGGDGGEATNSQHNHSGGNIAALTGNNVTVGNACLLATCGSRQDVDNDSNNASTSVDQTTVNTGGDGGHAISTATASTDTHQPTRSQHGSCWKGSTKRG